MRLLQVLFTSLLFSTYFINTTSAQDKYLIDNYPYYSVENQQAIESFLVENNAIHPFEIFLVIASTQQINNEPKKYISNQFQRLYGAKAICYLAEIDAFEKATISIHFPDAKVDFLNDENIEELSNHLKKYIEDRTYIVFGLEEAFTKIQSSYESSKWNSKYLKGLINATYPFGVTLVFFIPWYIQYKKHNKNDRYQDRFYQLDIKSSYKKSAWVGTVIIAILIVLFLGLTSVVLAIPIGYMISLPFIYYLALREMKKKDITTALKSFNSNPIHSSKDLNLAEAKLLLDSKTGGNHLMKNLLFDWIQSKTINIIKKDLVLYVKKKKKTSSSNKGIRVPDLDSDISMQKFIDRLYKMGQDSSFGFKKYVVAKSLVKKGLFQADAWAKSTWLLTEQGEEILKELREEVQKQENQKKRKSNLYPFLSDNYQNKGIASIKLTAKPKRKPKNKEEEEEDEWIWFHDYYHQLPENFFEEMRYSPFEELQLPDGKGYQDYYDSQSGDFDFDAISDIGSTSTYNYNSGYDSGSTDSGYSGDYDSSDSSSDDSGTD